MKNHLFRIAAIQMCSSENLHENLKTARDMLEKAKTMHAPKDKTNKTNIGYKGMLWLFSGEWQTCRGLI